MERPGIVGILCLMTSVCLEVTVTFELVNYILSSHPPTSLAGWLCMSWFPLLERKSLVGKLGEVSSLNSPNPRRLFCVVFELSLFLHASYLVPRSLGRYGQAL